LSVQASIRNIGLLLALSLVLASCAKKPTPFQLPDRAELAVAGFTQPDQRYEMLFGSMYGLDESVDSEVLRTMDTILRKELEKRDKRSYRGSTQVEQCREIVLYENEPAELDSLTYWSLVGRCVPAEYLLVPQLVRWQPRQGGKWGAEQAAAVEFSLVLLNVQKERIVSMFHFNQEQSSLSENLYTLPSFVQRGGEWITAEQLAREGIVQGLEELGL